MGSLISTPKTVTKQLVAPTPVSPPVTLSDSTSVSDSGASGSVLGGTSTNSTSTATTDTSASDIASSESVAEARNASLLSRDRGRFGTILTGFRGLFSGENATKSANQLALSQGIQSKSLLGE